MHYRALVEEWDDETLVFVRELPGFFVSARTGDAAMHAAQDAIDPYFDWLGAHQLPLPFADPAARSAVRIGMGEWLPASYELEGVGPLFKADLQAPTPQELDYALRVADAARADLVRVCQRMSPEAQTSIADADGWSIEDHLAHLARVELWYVAALNDGRMPTARLMDDPVEALQYSGEYAARRLRTLSSEQLGQVFTRDGEQWTAAKVLRRMIAHLREHYPLLLRLEKLSRADA